MATREPGVVTAVLKVMSRSKVDAEYQRAKGYATSAQIEEHKRLDWRYLRDPAKDWICAICAIQQKTGFALSALSSKETGLSAICAIQQETGLSAICAIQQKTGLALLVSALSSKRTELALSVLSSKRLD